MKTIELLKNTIPAMYDNGMTDLADFLKVMSSMNVQGDDLEEATKIFMAYATSQVTSDEEEEEDAMSVEEKAELCKELTQIFIDKEIGMGDAIEVCSATLSNALLQLSCDEDDEAKELINKTTDEAVRLMTTYLAASAHGEFPGLTALRLIALRFLHITSKEELMRPILNNALEEAFGDQTMEILKNFLEENGVDFDDCEDCEDCDDCDDCDRCCCSSDEVTEIEIEAGIKVRSSHNAEDFLKEAISGNMQGAVLAVNGENLTKEQHRALEKLTTKGPKSLTSAERAMVKKIILSAIANH